MSAVQTPRTFQTQHCVLIVPFRNPGGNNLPAEVNLFSLHSVHPGSLRPDIHNQELLSSFPDSFSPSISAVLQIGMASLISVPSVYTTT
jgi:hypothetical protein